MKLHPAQVATLYTLRRSLSARFRDLMRASGLESDSFKFHLQKLVKLGFVKKQADSYILTTTGKEFANNLDKSERRIQKQPKLSTILVVNDDKERFLFQQRKRHPYYDFWGCISGPVRWGEAPEATATRELKKQTGYEAEFVVHGFYRQRDYNLATKELLEDKLFTIVYAYTITGDMTNDWKGGFNQWMTLAELEQQEKVFANTKPVLALEKGEYALGDTYYRPDSY